MNLAIRTPTATRPRASGPEPADAIMIHLDPVIAAVNPRARDLVELLPGSRPQISPNFYR